MTEDERRKKSELIRAQRRLADLTKDEAKALARDLARYRHLFDELPDDVD